MMDGSSFQRARRATVTDAPHMLEIAQRAYREWPIDWPAVLGWLYGHLDDPRVFGCLSGDAATITMAAEWHWCIGMPPKLEIAMVYLAGVAQVWDVVRCLRLTAQWGRSIRAERFRVDSDTDVDLAPLARRIGLPFRATPGYSVRLQ